MSDRQTDISRLDPTYVRIIEFTKLMKFRMKGERPDD